MKNLISGLLLLFCLFTNHFTTVDEITAPVIVSESASSTLTSANVVYHYKGVAYPLFYKEGFVGEFVEEDNYWAVAAWIESADLTPFIFSDQPTNHLFYFDSEFEGYDYYEQQVDALLGRRFKNALRIDELRDQLMATYGMPLDFRNPALYAAAHAGIEAIRAELEIISPFPDDVSRYIGVPEGSLSQSNGRNIPVFTVYEHDNQGGHLLDIENGVKSQSKTLRTSTSQAVNTLKL